MAIALTQRIAGAGVLVMLGIGALTAIDVLVLRALLKAPIAGSNELLSTVFAAAIAAVLASGLAQRATLEIDLLSSWFGERTTRWLRATGSVLYFAVLVVVAWQVAEYAYAAYLRNTVTMFLRWPTWPFFGFIAALVVVCVPVQLLGAVRMLVDLSAADGRGRAIAAALVAILGGAALWSGIQIWQTDVAAHGPALAAAMFVLLWLMILLFVPLAPALVICGTLGTVGLMGSSSALAIIGSETVDLITKEDLAVIPFFLMMGGFAVAGGMSSDIYRLAHALFAPLRGGLALATIGGCAGFGALTGSSLATIASIGSAAYPEMKSRGYAPSLATGAIAAGGTLGQLVPPSTAIVVYALLVEESIGVLYIAVLVPAALTVLFYAVAVLGRVYVDPDAAPRSSRWDLAEVGRAATRCGPVFLLFAVVIGGIFAGVFTATEAAAIGAVFAFVVAWMRGKLSGGALWRVFAETTRSTSMLYFVIIGAMVITFFMGNSGLPQLLTNALLRSGMPALLIVMLIAFTFIVLGCVMESFTIMMITAPLVAAVITGLGYDSVWWGIIMVLLVELGVVTPPFGMNLFMMKAVAPDVPLGTVFRGVMPFVAADLVKIVLLLLFPQVILWLPHLASVK